MNPRSENHNGGPSINKDKETKTVMAEAFQSADQLVERVKHKTSDLQKQASNYATVTAEYAKEHPWRVILSAAGIGFIAGALLYKNRDDKD